MKIDAALAGVQRLYIETAPLIYYIEKHPTYITTMDALIKQVEQHSLEMISATLTLTEVLVHPLKQGNTGLAQQYRQMLLHNADLRLVPLTSATAERAAHLRAAYNLKTPDALQMATALETASDAFLSNDRGLLRVTEIRVLLVDDLEVP